MCPFKSLCFFNNTICSLNPWQWDLYYRQASACAECCSTSHHRHAEVWHGLSDLLHSELHWLDIYQRVQYKLGVTIYRCLQNRAPQYMADCCVRTSDVSSRQYLRSANRRQLVVPRHRRSKFGRRSFSVAAPMVWNSFRDSLRDPTLSIDNFRSTLKTHLFAAQRDT